MAMSIDYEQLRELLDESAPAPWEARAIYDDGAPRPDTSRDMRAGDEYIGIMHAPYADLAALAPELAYELLALRDKVAQLCDTLADLYHSAPAYGGSTTKAKVPAYVIERHLTALLDSAETATSMEEP